MSTDVEHERGRGRPREFDEEAVLDAVIELFAEHGFEASSLADIVEAAGLNKSSLYNAFGSKDELFRKALDRYIDRRIGMINLATSDGRGLDALVDLTELIRADALSEHGRVGCLAINSTAELGFTNPAIADIGRRFRDRIQRAIRRPLERAAELGEIDPTLVDVYVDAISSYTFATSLLARSGASADDLNRHIDSLVRLIETWRR